MMGGRGMMPAVYVYIRAATPDDEADEAGARLTEMIHMYMLGNIVSKLGLAAKLVVDDGSV